MNRYQRICEYCGGIFELNIRVGLKWAIRTGRGRFCSRECVNNWKKGQHFSPKTEFQKINDYDETVRHPRYKDGIWSYRKFIKSKCEDCDATDNLRVHHLDKNRHNNRLDNLKTLCHDCHWNYHRDRKAWNKGLKTGPLSNTHKQKLSIALRRYHEEKR